MPKSRKPASGNDDLGIAETVAPAVDSSPGGLPRAGAIALEETLAAEPGGAVSTTGLEATLASDGSPEATGGSQHGAGGRPNAALGQGDSVGRYVVLGLLGRGGMGEVYTAYDPELDRKIAVKVIRPGQFEKKALETTAQDRLMSEAQALARLSHPNVVAVYDVGTIDGDVYIAMEYVEGETLGAWLQSETRDLAKILELFIAAGRGLDAAHQAGLVHRDFKPDNVLVGTDGRPRVIDFGVAHGGSEESSSGLVGTPAYMAPEQFSGDVVDARTDEFCFAIALYEALTHQRPFEGDSVLSLARSVSQGEVREFERTKAVPGWLQEVVRRALEADPGDRYPDMAELLAALDRRPASRGRAWLAVAAVLVGGAALAYAALGSDAPPPCAGLEDRLEPVWGESTRAALAKALPAQHAGPAISVLDDYGQRWLSMRRTTCEDFRVRKALSQEAHDRRVSCLEGRLRDLDSEVSVLTEGGGELAERAVEAASSLPGLSICTNDAALAGTGAPPSEIPAEKVKEVEDLLRSARTNRLAGLYEKATQVAEAAVSRASKLDWQAAKSRAHFELGSMQLIDGKPKQARVSMFEAVRHGLAAGDLEAQAQAWVSLVRIETAGTAQYEEALRWARIAEAAVTQFGGDQELRGQLANYEAKALRMLERYPEALSRLRESRTLLADAVGEHSYRVAEVDSQIGATLRKLGHLEEGEEVMTHALAELEKILGKEHPTMATHANNLALIKRQLKKFDEARVLLERAMELKAKKLGADHPGLATSYLNLALLEQRAGNREKVVELWQRAYDLRQKAFGDGHPKTVRTLFWRVLYERNDGELDEARRRVVEVIMRVRSGGGSTATLGTALSVLCDVEGRLGRNGAARKACDESLDLLKGGAAPRRADALLHAASVDIAAGSLESAKTRMAEVAELMKTYPPGPEELAERTLVAAHLARASGDEQSARRLAGEARAGFAELGYRGFVKAAEELAQ